MDSLHQFSRLMGVAKKYKYIIILAIIGIGLSSIANYVIYKKLIPGLVDLKANFVQILPYATVAVFILRGVGEFLSKFSMGFVSRSTVRDQRIKILNHLLVLPTDYYEKNNSGEILSKINYNCEQIATAISDSILEFISGIAGVIVSIIVMFSISWQLSTAILVLAPFIALFVKFVGSLMRKYSKRVQLTMGTLTHVAAEVIDNYKEIRTFQGEDYEKNRIFNATENNRKQELKTFLVSSISAPMIQLIGALVLAVFLFLITRKYIPLTSGDLAGLVTAMAVLIQPLKKVMQVSNVFQKGIAAAESIHELLDVPEEIDLGTKKLNSNKIDLEIRNLSFSYSDILNKKVINNISLKIPFGKTVALVGSSGSGKTTLISLLPRFYDTKQKNSTGEILLNNINIKDLKLLELRKLFSIVSQNVVLFNDTIANNIAYGAMQNKSKQEIEAAAKAAFAYDFITKMPEGFDTVIGENGVLLSGGQRQRIAIARAILKDAPILILDEATSALDTESEKHIQLALDNAMKNRTTIVIAHRLSTIKKADKIFVLENGNLVESGTHHELLENKSRYADLQTV